MYSIGIIDLSKLNHFHSLSLSVYNLVIIVNAGHSLYFLFSVPRGFCHVLPKSVDFWELYLNCYVSQYFIKGLSSVRRIRLLYADCHIARDNSCEIWGSYFFVLPELQGSVPEANCKMSKLGEWQSIRMDGWVEPVENSDRANHSYSLHTVYPIAVYLCQCTNSQLTCWLTTTSSPPNSGCTNPEVAGGDNPCFCGFPHYGFSGESFLEIYRDPDQGLLVNPNLYSAHSCNIGCSPHSQSGGGQCDYPCRAILSTFTEK